jgi:hypothetical protein
MCGISDHVHVYVHHRVYVFLKPILSLSCLLWLSCTVVAFLTTITVSVITRRPIEYRYLQL